MREHGPPAGAIEAAREHYKALRLTEAERTCRAILQADPDHAEALYLLGASAHKAGQHGIALALIRKAIALSPNVPTFHRTHGGVCLALGRSADAVASFGRTVEIDPRDVKAHTNLGAALLDQGRVEEALASFRHALAIAPHFMPAHSNLLFAMHYRQGSDRAAALAEARRWDTLHAQPLMSADQPHPNTADPARRLRVGYVSGDFRRHSVGYLIEPILSSHDKSQVEVYCYSNNVVSDEMTVTLRAAADHWRDIAGTEDQAAAEMIRRDAIDCLVDLSGHTRGHRLLVFARKPAPVQVTWMGYSDTTGMSSMDYILLDRHVCPVGDERYFVEQVVRLPDSYICYAAPESVPDIAPPPELAGGRVTFGSFNTIAKVRPEVIAVWAKILRSVPASRLCLKTPAMDDLAVRDRYTRMLADHGITADRLLLVGKTTREHLLNLYGQLDIALDPFPYNGTVTTLEALWMGVPVISLGGDQFIGRVGISFLTSLGEHGLLAQSIEDYVRKAVTLACDLPRRTSLRRDLRRRLIGSPLCDAAQFTRALEATYRHIWTRWCEG